MRQKLLLLVALLVAIPLGLRADDVFKDVTSTYLTNADFEGTYNAKSGTGVSSDRAIYEPNGWTVSYSSFTTNECSALKSGDKQWNFFKSYSSASSGGSQTYWTRLHKDGNGQRLELSQTVTIKGTFKLSAVAFRNENKGNTYIQFNNSTYRAAVSENNSWQSISVSFTSDGSTTTTITCGAWHGNNNSNYIAGFDNVKLEWNLTKSLTDLLSDANTFYTNEGDSYTALKAVIDATDVSETDADELEAQYNALAAALDLAKNHRKPWLTAWTTANTNYASATYANVTGTEKTALKTEIDKSEPSTANAYDSAASDLTTANNTFTAAKTNYDKYAAEVENATALGVDPVPALDVASNYSDKLKALIVLEDAAVTAGFTQDITARVVDSWSTSNADEKTDAEHWSGESHTYYNRYQESGFTMYAKKTVSLPAGTYVLKAAARCDKRNEENGYYLGVTIDGEQTKELYTSTSGGTGKGIATNGNANYTEGTFANEGAGYGWEWRFVGFTLVETKEVELKISANILAKGWVSFSDIQLLATSATEKNVLIKLLNEEITAAAAIDNTTNVGSNVFQIPSSAAEALDDAITAAQGIYDASALKSSSELEDAIDDLKSAETTFAAAELNAPDSEKRYYLTIVRDGKEWNGKAITFMEGAANPTQGNYGIKYLTPANNNMCQAVKFTNTTGNKYKVSFLTRAGVEQYITTSNLGYSAGTDNTNKERIRTVDDASKALEIEIKATTTANQFLLYNTDRGAVIADNNNNDVYTNNSANFTISEASQASVTVAAKASKFATVIFPFTPDVSTGFDDITFYNCAGENAGVATLEKVTTLAANTPYLIKNTGTSDFSTDLSGWGTASEIQYAKGVLTGIYTAATIPAGSYVLQTPKSTEVQAFYPLATTLTGTPNRCYLTLSNSAAKRNAIFFDKEEGTTGIEAPNATNGEDGVFYNLAGQRVNRSYKGIIIQNRKAKLNN